MAEGKAKTSKKYTFRFKPCYNFQSVEVEFKGNLEDIPEMMDVYKLILEDLMKIAPEQSGSKQIPQAKETPSSKPASIKQLEIMEKCHIDYPEGVSMEEARILIKKYFEEKANK